MARRGREPGARAKKVRPKAFVNVATCIFGHFVSDNDENGQTEVGVLVFFVLEC